MFGWGSSSAKSNEPPPAPSREERKQCWATRDAYFDCLTRVNIINPGDEGKDAHGREIPGGGEVCKAERELYNSKCGKAWIEYFNTRRGLEYSQRATLAQARAQGVNVPEFRR